MLSFTSGSSGSPKIANRSHGFLVEQFNVLKEVTKCNGTENICVGLAVVVLFYLAQGNTVVLRTSKMLKKPKLLSQLLTKYEVNQLIDSPAKFLSYIHFLNKDVTTKITHTFCGGGPVFVQDATEINSILNLAENTVIYGSTEVEPISIVSTKTILKFSKNKGLCVGKVNSELNLKIIDINKKHKHILPQHEFDSICLHSPEVGEIIVSGNHVLNDYYKSPDVLINQKIKVNNTLWHKTGDSGFIKDGLLFLTGQCDTLIQIGNEFISPFIVEQQLRQIKGVKKGTVIKINTQIIVVVESNLPIKELKIDLPFEFDKIRKIAEIPTDVRHNTKIDYQKLRKLLE